MQKTNVMRILDQKKIPYDSYSYPNDGSCVDGVSVAALIGKEPAQVFKTLVARGASRACYVFVLPVDRELDLKKAAAAAGEKSMAMLRLQELTPLTGYVRGGCSPIGMKKLLRTFFDRQAEELGCVIVSAGKIGAQVEVKTDDILRLTGGEIADVAEE